MNQLQPRTLRFAAPDADKENAGVFSPVAPRNGIKTPATQGTKHTHGFAGKPLTTASKLTLGAKTPLLPKNVQLPKDGPASTGPLKDKHGQANVPRAQKAMDTPGRGLLASHRPPTVHKERALVRSHPTLDHDWEPEYMPPPVKEAEFDPEITIDTVFLAQPSPYNVYTSQTDMVDPLPSPEFDFESLQLSPDSVAEDNVHDFSALGELNPWAAFDTLPLSPSCPSAKRDRLATRIPRAPQAFAKSNGPIILRTRRRLSYRPSRLRQPTNWRIRCTLPKASQHCME
ncbi:hypothetical protein H4R35_000715 [Dimargaris xerosporica]|nr:hypothetical protein H4R35_000715 [Dimargaris xerosporica]